MRHRHHAIEPRPVRSSFASIHVNSRKFAVGCGGFIRGIAVGCASPVFVASATTPSAVERASAVDTIDVAPLVEPPTVEVREYTRSPTVAVVGWAPEETAYGLRTVLRRDGTSDLSHRLYVSTYFVPGSGDITQAVGLSQPLQLLGVSRDDQNCYRTINCSPYETFGARIPDALLRANRDSMAVKFYARSGSELLITVHRDLIQAYLGAVDSVSAVLRRK